MPATARAKSFEAVDVHTALRDGDHQASKRGVIGEDEHGRWCHLLWKTICFSMCAGSASWCHLSTKSLAISTNGLLRSESSRWRTPPGSPPFAQRALWNIGPLQFSLRLDVGVPDHLAPFLGLVGDELAKVGRREREHDATQVGKPRLDLGVGEASIDLFI